VQNLETITHHCFLLFQQQPNIIEEKYGENTISIKRHMYCYHGYGPISVIKLFRLEKDTEDSYRTREEIVSKHLKYLSNYCISALERLNRIPSKSSYGVSFISVDQYSHSKWWIYRFRALTNIPFHFWQAFC
jgi:hypothetical protein